MKKRLLVLISLLSLSTTSCYQLAPKEQVRGVVVSTERVQSSESSVYRVGLMTSSGAQTFVNVDALEIGKFNSGDIQTTLASYEKNGQEVCLEVYGWRVPFLSMFKNVKGICPL